MPVGRSLVFLRITGKKYSVLYRSQVKNISYPTDHRQNLFWFFRITGKNYFVLYRAQAKTISYSTDHRQKLFRTLPITGKKYFVLYRKDISVSTAWWEVSNHIRYGIRKAMHCPVSMSE